MSIIFSNTLQNRYIPLDLVYYSYQYNLPHYLSSLPSEVTSLPDGVISDSIVSFLVGRFSNPKLQYTIHTLQFEKRSNIHFCVPSENGNIQLTIYSQNDIQYLTDLQTEPDKFFLKLHKLIRMLVQTGNYKFFVDNLVKLLSSAQVQQQSTYDSWVTSILLSHVESTLETYREFVS